MIRRTLLLTIALAATAGILGPWLDGQPSETYVARSVAADLRDAQADARKAAHLARAKAAMQRDERRPSVRTATMGTRA